MIYDLILLVTIFTILRNNVQPDNLRDLAFVSRVDVNVHAMLTAKKQLNGSRSACFSFC